MNWNEIKKKLKKVGKAVEQWAAAPGPSSALELIDTNIVYQNKKKKTSAEDFLNF